MGTSLHHPKAEMVGMVELVEMVVMGDLV